MDSIKTKRGEILFLAALLGLAAFLRFIRLDTLPVAIFRDEAEKAVTAFSVFRTGRALTGPVLPLFVSVFGVTTSMIYQYFTVPFVALLGLNEWSTRLPAALIGTATVGLNYLLMRRRCDYRTALWATAFLAMSPWHIVFSRWAQQGIFLPFLLVCGVLCFDLFRDGRKFALLLSAFCFALAIYSYEVARVFVPLLLLLMVTLYWRELVRQKPWFLGAVVIFLLFTAPVVHLLFTQNEAAQARFRAISIMKPGRSPLAVAMHFLGNYLEHFSPEFLLMRGDPEPRHSAGVGQLTLVEFCSLIIGIIWLLRKRTRDGLFWLGWIMLFPVAASMTQVGIPHALRCIVALPALQNVSAMGLVGFLDSLSEAHRPRYVRFAAALTLLSFIPFAFVYYSKSYTLRSAPAWQYGVKNTVLQPFPGTTKTVFYNVMGAEYLVSFYCRVLPEQIQKEGLKNTRFEFAPFGEPAAHLFTRYDGVPTEFFMPPIFPGPADGRMFRIECPGLDAKALQSSGNSVIWLNAAAVEILARQQP